MFKANQFSLCKAGLGDYGCGRHDIVAS